MQLGVFDRLILLNILPKEGDFTTLKIIRKLREDLSFTEDEHKALNFVQEEGNIKWQTEADIPKEILIGEKATDIIVEVLKKLDKDKKLTDQHVSVYEKFVS
ncbi:MAG: hypothetical protein PHI12_08835 [Dehalococcoidales bacterium]|nr:hypothetical protein [Dehalococcoidales bacterium]